MVLRPDAEVQEGLRVVVFHLRVEGGSAAKIGKFDHQGLDHFNQNAHVSTVKRECEGSDRFLKLSHRSYFEFQQMLNLMFVKYFNIISYESLLRL